jgi:uncharacterized protein (DUF1800 family)
VIAEWEEAHKKFPIALMNRLEKHFVAFQTDMREDHKALVRDTEAWIKQFCASTGPRLLK